MDCSDVNIAKERLPTVSYLSEFSKQNRSKKKEEDLLEDINKWYILLVNGIHQRGKDVNFAKKLLFCFLFVRLLEINQILAPKWMLPIYFHDKKEKANVPNGKHTLRIALQEMFDDYGIDLFTESLTTLDDLPNEILLEILKESDVSSLAIEKIYKSHGLPSRTVNLGIYGHNTQAFSLDTLNAAYEELFHYDLDKKTDRSKKSPIDSKKKQTQRKSKGAYFTPRDFAEFLVEITLKPRLTKLKNSILKELENEDNSKVLAIFKKIHDIKILDPACGNGVFLTAAYRETWNFYKDLKKKIKERRQFHVVSDEFVGIGQRILLNNIFGVDKDPQAVEITKLNLWLHLLVSEQTRYDIRRKEEKTIKLPPLDSNILIANSIWHPKTTIHTIDQNLREKLFSYRKAYQNKLIESYKIRDIDNREKLREEASTLEKKLQKVRKKCWENEAQKIAISGLEEGKPIVWPLVFPEVFFRSNSGFDIILTNPPFLAYHSRQTQSISPELLTLFLQLYPVLGQRRPNSYLFFLELSFSYLLRKSGRIGLIVDQALRDLPAYKHVREFMLNNLYIETIIPQVEFPGATVDVTLIVAELPDTTGILKQPIKWMATLFDYPSPILLEKAYFSTKPNCEFIFSTQEHLLRKIEKHPSIPLGGKEGLCDLACGLEYSVLLKKHFLSSFKEDKTFHPAVDGATDIPNRYTLAWYPKKGNKAYVRFDKSFEEKLIIEGKNLSNTGKTVIFVSGNETRYKKPKIILRQTCTEFCGILDENKDPYGSYYSLRNTHVINLKENSPVTLPYILGILNSHLIALYGREKNIIRTTGKNRQPQIRIRDLERIPLVLPPIALREQCFHFFDKYVKRLSALKRTIALLGIYYGQQITDRKKFDFQDFISLDNLLKSHNEVLEALWINLKQSRKIKKTEMQIPRYYKTIFANEYTIKLICKNADKKETTIVQVNFDPGCPNWVKDFLYLTLSSKSGKTSYKSKVSLQIPLKKRFNIPIPVYEEISKLRNIYSSFISLLWAKVAEETKIQSTSAFAILHEASQIDDKIEQVVRALYGIEGDLSQILTILS